MWYVIQVRTGSEEKIKQQCERYIPFDILEQCIIPYYERMRRYEGEWHKEWKILFPGYVFLVSSDVDSLFFHLKNIFGLTKLIGTGKEIVSLTENEITFIRRLGNDRELVEMSQGIMKGGRTIITEGPLMGLEGYIKRIDRHKRIAWLEIELMGQTVDTQVGLEILEKG